ncbi:MAG: VWA domain-containing protein [Clostridia bacterium]|nr:VWA domain-containing protein [Clostridia bacterium]
MINISFDNPYLLLIAIPVIAGIVISYFIVRNKDNKSIPWLLSLVFHIAITVVVTLAIAGLSRTTLLTETTIYVVADVSHSSEKNLDKIDEYIEEISQNLPQKTKLGVVCFGKNQIITTPVGRKIVSVKDSGVDASATNIAKALDFTESLFKGDTQKKIILITDGNDTINENASTIASCVERLSENGVQIDAIFLDNTLTDTDKEIQLLEVESPKSSYLGSNAESKILIQSTTNAQVLLELYSRKMGEDGAEFEKITQKIVSVEKGLTTSRLTLDTKLSDTYEYKVLISSDSDTSEVNNVRYFAHTVEGQEKILLITGNPADTNLVQALYGEKADIDSYVVTGSNTRVPFKLEELVEYDEFVISSLDIRNIKNVNAFIDSLDMVISQYGKSLITLGNLELQTNSDDAIFQKFAELLPVKYGTTNRDGRLYTVVLDVSHSMFMASKFTIAKQSAIKLISVLDDEDYVCLVTFSGDVKVQTPKKVKECKEELIEYINKLTTAHGTDIGLGLEEALKTVEALNLTENQIMVISDGFSFRSEHDAVEISKKLYGGGAVVSSICTYIMAEGDGGYETLNEIALSGGGKPCYKISRPEDVAGVVFGQVAEDIGDVVIEKEATVSISKYNDPIVSGISTVPNVSGFIISLEKYDATVPLTITYEKANGYQETVPLYAYRSHGNGRVASFTSNLSTSWTALWSSETKEAIVSNMLSSNTPKERVNYPFTVNMERNDYSAYIEIVPSVLNPSASTVIDIIYPNGRKITRTLTFDAKKYYYTLDLGQIGTYTIDIKYSYDDKVFTTSTSFNIPYTAEYNEFVVCDKFSIYEFLRGNGTISIDEIPSLENDETKITTYKQSFVIPLLIIAVVLFVIDVFIRKLRAKRKAVKK